MVVNFINENKGAITFAVLLMILGSLAYFWFNNFSIIGTYGDPSKNNKDGPSVIFQQIRIKVIQSPDGTIHLLANSKNNALSGLKAIKGDPIPEDDSAVLGSAEADWFKAVGRLPDTEEYLGIYFEEKTKLGGILAKRGDIVDNLVFLSSSQYEKTEGKEGKVFVKLTQDGLPKLFFILGSNESGPQKFSFAEGSMDGYEQHYLGNSFYYPIILGSKEAKIMRDEKLFENIGDAVRGFFGKNFIVVGVLEETNTSIDGMHFVPLKEGDLTDDNLTGD